MEVPWVIDEQTRIKHALLNSYIRPWMAIFFRTQAKYNLAETLFYFDGFAGPGTYYTDATKAETCDGSPVIVARAANDYIQANPLRRVVIFCIDRDKQCADLLEQRLTNLNTHKQVWRVVHADFDQTVNEILNQVDSRKLSGYPMFFFIDPFGYSGYPLQTVRRILQYRRAEVFINFMVYDIVRFASQQQYHQNLTALFGSTDFLRYKQGSSAEERQAFLLNIYCEALHSKAGASFVMPFRLNTPCSTNRPRYYLLHASNNLKALKVMKDTMWKYSESEFRFEAIGINTDQLNLFADPDKVSLRERMEAYCRQRLSLQYEEIEDWAYATTGGVTNTIKHTLLDLEKDCRIKVQRRPRQHKSTVTAGAIIYPL